MCRNVCCVADQNTAENVRVQVRGTKGVIASMAGMEANTQMPELASATLWQCNSHGNCYTAKRTSN
eukprot:3362119-Prorocentrum_lima.AAC.1